jgi:Nicotianamine synthase protein
MNRLVERFLALMHERIRSLRESQSLQETHRRINDVEHLLLCDLLTEEEEYQLFSMLETPDLLRDAQDLFCRFETSIEKSMARYIMGVEFNAVSSSDNITQNYLQRYHTLARREIRLASIGPKERVLFIGSGPFPITAIEYVRQAGCVVDCVDHLREPIDISMQVIHRLGMNGQIRLIYAKGQDCEVSNYDVILVAVLAQPKEQVLLHLDSAASPRSRILCRTTTGVRQFIYPRTTPIKLVRFNPAGFSRAVCDQVISTQLLTVNAGTSEWEWDGRTSANGNNQPSRGETEAR